MKYNAKSVSLRYVGHEDRIQCVCHCDANDVVAIWITRRMLDQMLPQLAQWMNNVQNQAVEAAGRTSVEANQLNRFDHEAAQTQVKSVKEKRTEVKLTGEFLLQRLGITPEQGKLKIRLLPADDKLVVELKASALELHKVMGELLTLSDSAGWSVANPWHGSRSELVDSKDVFMH